MSSVKYCRGISISAGTPCPNKVMNIWGFCNKHIEQSEEYARTSPNAEMMVGMCDDFGTEIFLTFYRRTVIKEIFSAWSRIYHTSPSLEIRRNGRVVGTIDPEDSNKKAMDFLKSNDRLFAC